MTPQTSALVAICAIAAVFIAILPNLYSLHGRSHWYDAGWRDCENAHEHFAMTPDDEAVLKELRTALKAHIKAKGYYRKGDMKVLDRAENFEELRHITWDLCIRRKELP